MNSPQAHLEALRDTFHQPPSARAWARVCETLDQMDPGAVEVGLNYAADHLSAWPDGLRAQDWLNHAPPRPSRRAL